MPFRPRSPSTSLSKHTSYVPPPQKIILYHTPEVLQMLHTRALNAQALISEQRTKLRSFEVKVDLLATALVTQFGVPPPVKRKKPPMPRAPRTRCINDYLGYLGGVVRVTEWEMDELLRYSLELDRLVDTCRPGHGVGGVGGPGG
ncbi:MAG: hypothetical protein M1829_006795 [Trizodia sp. TS-e1964]|nr:MAG: hypothetical protein M1829_006795 [Trizodia sp. TS-e1964]